MGSSYTKSIFHQRYQNYKEIVAVKLKHQSKQPGLGYLCGPELAVDKQGLYAVWSREKECIDDINFEVLGMVKILMFC